MNDIATIDSIKLQARLVEAIHENGRLADRLNRVTAELAAERGFLANARARADQAEIDRDEWRAAAERWKQWAEARMVQGALQDALQADAAPQTGDGAQTFDDRLADRLRASEVDVHGSGPDEDYAALVAQKAARGDDAASDCWRCGLAAVLTCALVVAIAVAIAFWSFVAHAHPAGVPQDGSEVSEWFERQHNVDGGVCCGSYDAYFLADDDWVMTARGYRVHLGDGWYDVPPSKLRDTAGGPNPTGQAIIWYAQSQGETPVIWCFAPGTTY